MSVALGTSIRPQHPAEACRAWYLGLRHVGFGVEDLGL